MFRSSLLYVWATRGPFGRLTKSLCDFDYMTPHTLVSVELRPPSRQGGQGSAFGRIVETSKRSKGGLGTSRGHPVARAPEALDRCTGVSGAARTARNTRHDSWSSVLDYDREA